MPFVAPDINKDNISNDIPNVKHEVQTTSMSQKSITNYLELESIDAIW